MTQITLTADQAALVNGSESLVVVSDPSGQVLGFITKSAAPIDENSTGFTPEEIAAALLGEQQTTVWRTTAEILERLNREMPVNDQ